MKRVISILIIFVLAFPLSACGGAVAPIGNESPQAVADVPFEQPAVEPTAEATAAEAAPTPLPEVVLMDADGITLKVTAFGEDDQGEYTIAFSLKNGTEGTLDVYADFIFNGWVAPDTRLRLYADANSDAKEIVTIPKEFFALCEIETVAEIQIRFSVYSNYDELAKDTVVIFPKGEEEAKIEPTYQYQPKDGEALLFESEGVRAIMTGLLPDDPNGYGVQFYVENTSAREFRFDLFNGGVNSYSYWFMNFNSPFLPAGTRMMVLRNFDTEELASDGVLEITRIDFGYRLVEQGHAGEDLVSGTKTIYPSGVETPRVERTPVEGEVVLVDNKDFTIIVTGCLNNVDSYRYGLNIYAENKTDKEVSIELQNPEVNGKLCFSNSLIADLPAGMRTNVIYTWGADAFEKAGLTDDTSVEQVTLPIYIFSDGNRKAGDEVYRHTFKVKVW